jgi:hypothetical protein
MRDPISDKKTKEPNAQCANPRDFSAFVARRTNNFRLSHTNMAAATIARNAIAQRISRCRISRRRHACHALASRIERALNAHSTHHATRSRGALHHPSPRIPIALRNAGRR